MESAVNKMLEEIGPRYAKRAGGYTRIIKLGRRQGDGAEIAQIQLIRDASAGSAEQAVETAPVEAKAKKSPAAKQKAKSE
jgi:large subunit ribosomal protein L17